MLMVFLILALHYACNILEIVGSSKKLVHKRSFDALTFYVLSFSDICPKDIRDIQHVLVKM